MSKLAVLTNRNFELPKDGWYQVAPKGEYNHPTGIIQVIDEEALEAMKNRFDEESKEPNFPGLLFDFDHFSNDSKAPSAAAGWIEDLKNREDGLWAKVRWSKSGKAALEGGDYRLASPVWNRADCEELGENRFRPLRLDRCALTNDPNLKGMVPLANRAGSADEMTSKERQEMTEEIVAAVLKRTGKTESTENRGTSAGAHKGWETRRGALAAYHSGHAKSIRAFAEKGGTAEQKASLEKMAENHEKLAAGYAGKAKVSGAKAHINKQLEKMKSAKAASKPKAKAKATPPPLPKKK